MAITTSVWDFENLNTATVTPSSRVTLVYNGDKLRVEKDSSTSGTARFVYDGQNILLETDGSNLTQAVYTLEPKEFGKLVSQRQLQMGVWVPIYYAFDALGSTDSLTDSAAVITDTYTYFAFGKSIANTGSTPNRFTWVGELMYMQDPETGEVQLHLRQTDPDRGRWKSEDPKGLAVDPNLFRLVTNNPVNATDPSGLDPNAGAGGGQRFVSGPDEKVYTPEEIAELEKQIYMNGKVPFMWSLPFPFSKHLYVTGQHLPAQRTPKIVMPGQPGQKGEGPPDPKPIALTAVETDRSSTIDTFIGLYNHETGKVTRKGVDLPLKDVLDLATGQNGYRKPTAAYWDSVFRGFETVNIEGELIKSERPISYLDDTESASNSGSIGETKRMVQPLVTAMAVHVITEAAIQYIGGPLAGKAVGFALSKGGGALSVVFKKEGKYFAKELAEAETASVIKVLKNEAADGSDEAVHALSEWAKSEGKAGTQAAKALEEIGPSNLGGVPLESRFRANMKAANTAGMTTGTKGMLGEARTAIAMRRAGFEELPARLPSNNGFDGVWIKRAADGEVSEILITESKFAYDGAMRLTQTKTMGKQLSETWIDGNIQKMLNSDNPAVVRAAQLLDANKALIKPKVAVLDSDGILRFYDP